jgi:hypothetical protein
MKLKEYEIAKIRKFKNWEITIFRSALKQLQRVYGGRLRGERSQTKQRGWNMPRRKAVCMVLYMILI